MSYILTEIFNKPAFTYIFLFTIGCILILLCSFFHTYYRSKRKKTIILGLDQETTQARVQVQGTLPYWLKGTYVRNGPINVQVNNTLIPHWFDGLAMLHAFSFNEGIATYTNKFINSFAYQSIFKRGDLYFGGFATKSNKTLWQKFIGLFKLNVYPVQNANVSVANLGNKPIALTETPLPVTFDINTLETIGPLVFNDKLPKKNVFESAHIQFDMIKNEKINYLVEYGFKSHYIVYRLNEKTKSREIISKIPVKKPAYMHSFAITEDYIILVEFPMLAHPLSFVFCNKPFIKNYSWQPEAGTQFIVINRQTSETHTFKESTGFFAFHHVNAFQKGKNIILDMVTYPNADIISDIAVHDDVNSPYALHPKTKLMRYTLSLASSEIHSKVLFDAAIEFPKINPRYNTGPYRYVYLADPRLLENPESLRPLYKFDIQSQKYLTWQEPGMLPGEPLFIPNPKIADDEDEGVVVSIVLDNVLKNAFLLILDAKTFVEMGRVYAPFAIPAGLHGYYFD